MTDQPSFIAELIALKKKYSKEMDRLWLDCRFTEYGIKRDEKLTEIERLLNKCNITIKGIGSCNIGRCYNEYYHRVTFLTEPSNELIHALHDADIIGCGQEWHYSKPAWSEQEKKFVVNVTTRIDSSD